MATHVSEMEKANRGQAIPEAMFLTLLVQSMPGCAIIIRNSDLKIVAANARFEHTLNYSHQEILSGELSFADVLCPDFLSRFLSFREKIKARSTDKSSYFVSKLRSTNGTVNEYFTHLAPVVLDQGGDQQLFSTILLHANNSSYEIPFSSFEARELYLSQLEKDEFGIVEWVTGMSTCFVSMGINRLIGSGQTTAEMAPQLLLSFFTDFQRRKLQVYCRKLIAHTSDFEINIPVNLRLSEERTFNIEGRSFEFGAERKKLVFCVKDITREQVIHQNYLRKVKELKESNKELEEFAYVASHDLQEPLRKISTFCDRLVTRYGDQLQGDGIQYLERALASAENMRVLINDLLEFSRISKTRQPFELLDLNLVFRVVKSDLELLLDESGARLNCSKLTEIEGVRSQLVQLLSNVIGNAIKFRDKGRTTVINVGAASVTNKEKVENELSIDEDYIRLTVSDNGIGFDDIYASRIFQIFQRLHGKTDYPGSGIGLAICKRIVEYHGGRMFATSKPGQGANFTMIFPVKQNVNFRNDL